MLYNGLKCTKWNFIRKQTIIYWWEDFALSFYIFSDIEMEVRKPENIPVPQVNF